jgi:hypothetical protein
LYNDAHQLTEPQESPLRAAIPLAWTLIAVFWIAVLAPPYPVEPLPVGASALMEGVPSAYRSATSRLPRFAFVSSDPCVPEATIGFASLDIPPAVGFNAAVPRANRASVPLVVLFGSYARAPPA